MYYCVRHTVRGTQCDPRNNLPERYRRNGVQEVLGTAESPQDPQHREQPRSSGKGRWRGNGFLLGTGISSQGLSSSQGGFLLLIFSLKTTMKKRHCLFAGDLLAATGSLLQEDTFTNSKIDFFHLLVNVLLISVNSPGILLGLSCVLSSASIPQGSQHLQCLTLPVFLPHVSREITVPYCC